MEEFTARKKYAAGSLRIQGIKEKAERISSGTQRHGATKEKRLRSVTDICVRHVLII